MYHSPPYTRKEYLPPANGPAAAPEPAPSYEPFTRLSQTPRETTLHVERQSIAPPPYAAVSVAPSTNTFPSSPSHPDLSLPIVIPQTNKSLRGAFFSPFLRVYPPVLETADPPISKVEFVRFIDDLNEAFLGSPYLQAIGLAGTFTSFVPLLTAQIVGASVSTASGFVSAAVSYTRTRAFVRNANENFFGPRGLQMRILNAKDMMAKIGREGDVIQLPRLPELNEDVVTEGQVGAQDPRMRWLAALEGSVAPLDWDVPEIAVQENWMKKPGAWQARRQEEKKREKLEKDRGKARKEVREAHREVTERRRSMDKEVTKLHKEILKVQDKAANEMRKKGDSEREMQKIERERQKETAKLQKEIDKELREFDREEAKIDKAIGKDKEQKKVHKIRWIVITRTTDPVDEQEVDVGVESATSEEFEQYSGHR